MRGTVVSLLALVAACSVFAACRSSVPSAATPPARSCELVVWYRAPSPADHVEVIGSWDGYARPGRVLDADRADGWRASSWTLAPGVYTYGIVDDGQWVVDPTVPVSAFHEGQEVAWVTIPDCGVPAVAIDSSSGSTSGDALVSATFSTAKGGAPLDPTSLSLESTSGESLSPLGVAADPKSGKLSFSLAGLAPGKHSFLVHARDAQGNVAEAAQATVWIELRAFDWRDAVLYQVMVDRYRAADGSALSNPATPASRAGGHVLGVKSAIDSGELTALGVNTLWLSPLYDNPDGTYPGADGRAYSSYHGYWPRAARDLETSMANQASVAGLITSAHARGMRVLFDVVPNHVHETHPYWQEHQADGWFNNPGGGCVCGTATCDWTTHEQDCWFAPYLPNLDWTNQAVANQASLDVAWWLSAFDADGIRIDAVPMMPRAATRRIAWNLRQRLDYPGHQTFVLGENYTGPAGYDEIRYDLGPFGLSSAFHFPLLWALRGAIAEGSETMTDVESAISAGLTDWQGSGAVMSLFIGNHDMARFASDAAGDANGDTWTPAPQPTDAAVYQKQAMALGLVFALPGAPTIFYGDEVGLAGGGDPDCRRVMPDEAALTELQKGVRTSTSAYAKVRACSDALRRGTYRTLFVDAEHLVFAREGAGDPVIVVAQRNAVAPLSAPLPGIAAGDYVDPVSGASASLTGALTNLPARPFSVQFFLPVGSACAQP